MVHIYRVVKLLLTVALLFSLFVTATWASWAYPFVVNDGKLYVTTKEPVEETLIDKEVGEVTYFSDQEGSYGGNFSNIYPKGTPYYSIRGIDPDEAIAIKTTEGTYIRAVFEYEYAGGDSLVQSMGYSTTKSEGSHDIVILIVLLAAFAAVIVLIVAAVYRKLRESNH